jgi:hypothetical protein
VRRALLALAGLALLTGCDAFDVPPPVSAGYVQARSYDDPDDWTTREPTYRYECRYEYDWQADEGNGGFRNVCKDRVVGHHTVAHHDGPHWFLRIREDAPYEKGKRVRVEDVEVDQATHDTFLPGMHWPDPR